MLKCPVIVVCRELSLRYTQLCSLALWMTPLEKTIPNRFLCTNHEFCFATSREGANVFVHLREQALRQTKHTERCAFCFAEKELETHSENKSKKRTTWSSVLSLDIKLFSKSAFGCFAIHNLQVFACFVHRINDHIKADLS